jgi:hypothetical protein
LFQPRPRLALIYVEREVYMHEAVGVLVGSMALFVAC